MHILLTRPLEDCSEMVVKFKSLGHQVSNLPLLKIDKINYNELNFLDFEAIIFTSANAIKFLDTKKIDKNSSIAELLYLIGQFIGFKTLVLSTYKSAIFSPLAITHKWSAIGYTWLKLWVINIDVTPCFFKPSTNRKTLFVSLTDKWFVGSSRIKTLDLKYRPVQ